MPDHPHAILVHCTLLLAQWHLCDAQSFSVEQKVIPCAQDTEQKHGKQLQFLAPEGFFKAVKRLQFFIPVDFVFDLQFSRAWFVMSTHHFFIKKGTFNHCGRSKASSSDIVEGTCSTLRFSSEMSNNVTPTCICTCMWKLFPKTIRLSSFPLLLVVVLAEHGGCLSSVDRDRELRIWSEREARQHECETRWTAYLERARSSSERV